MRILLINTCGSEGIIALAEDSAVLAREVLSSRGTSEGLMPAIRSLLSRHGRPDVIGIVIGPGSFTGTRLGLAAAKGLCEGFLARMVAMSRLALVAASAESSGPVLALLDAGRGEFYSGLYPEGHEQILHKDEVCALLPGRTAVACEARAAQSLGDRVRLVPEPGPERMLRMVLDRAARDDWSDVATTDANYLRRTDAELLVAKH